MKSVLISIRPEWCGLIASGKKTIEVRKTRPKIPAPFRCYIYQCLPKYGNWNDRDGMVIGEFVCDCVKTYPMDDFVGAKNFDGSIITEPKDGEFAYWIPEQDMTCLSYNEIRTYGNGKTLYGWHISDLKIYDKPKELGSFWKAGKCPYAAESGCTYEYHCFRAGQTQRCGETLTRPPQSWCYVDAE